MRWCWCSNVIMMTRQCLIYSAMMRWYDGDDAMKWRPICDGTMQWRDGDGAISKYVNLHDRASLYYPCSIDISHLIVPLSLHHFQRDIASSGHRTIASLHCHIIVIAPSRYRSIDPDLDGAIVHPDSIPGRNGTSKLVENLFTKRHLRIQER